ncbi:MAG: hypothetical protein RL153_1452 [Verrucomicrobiota bacterium]
MKRARRKGRSLGWERWILGLALSAAGLCGVVHAEEPKLPADHVNWLGRATHKGQVTDADRGWWSFRPLARVTPPKVRDEAWVRTPVDRFVLAAMEAKGVRPAPEAPARTLARRAALDVTGLPPSPEDVEAFERDGAPDAWDRWVARLLASPAHGERWARHWLDVARFAESSGFEHDYDRPNAFHYRDFVIRAFNADLPFDDFVRWQLAGDEHDAGNPMAMMATGFLGAGVFPTQITANEVERTRYDAMDDMLATTGTAFLGLTVGCARCHDHKFDPIPARDYYRLLSTFTTTVRAEVDVDMDPEGYRRAKAIHDAERRPLEEALRRYEADVLPGRLDAWVASGGPARLAEPAWELVVPTEAKSRAGAMLRPLGDGSFLAEGKNGDTDRYTFVSRTTARGVRALRVEALAHPSMTRGGPGRADNGNIGLSRVRAWVRPASGGEKREVKFGKAWATFEQNAGGLSVTSALDGERTTGWAVDPKFGEDHAAVFELAEPVGFEGGTEWEVRLEFELNTRHNIGRPRLSLGRSGELALKGAVMPGPVAEALAALRAGRGLDAGARAALMAWWRVEDPGWREASGRLEAHVKAAPKPSTTKVLACAEGYPAVRMHTQGGDFLEATHFLRRGSTEQKDGVATPGLLSVLLRAPEDRWTWRPPEGARHTGRRRTLAAWLTDADQGAGHLVARVIVNRVWQQHFGTGLVATPNDFGTQGARPTHPELLDWLAGELVHGGWRLKPLHRLILESATYRQSAAVDAMKRASDPSNALWSRWTPRRLEAEALRDAMLAASGVLDPAMYGRGTLDPATRRRSVYLTVKRSQLVGDMVAFDAPEPLTSQARRPVTTVAPQALLLMNGPHVRSWAEAMARRAGAGRDADEAVARRMYGLALGRDPTAREQAAALAYVRGRGAADGGARVRAWADVGQVIFGLDEFAYLE